MKDEAAPDRDGAAKRPVHEAVYEALRELVLFGEMAPGQPVTIQGLSQLSGAGMTPVREAIRRLISDGALISRGNRRVSVPALTAPDLEELVFLRKSIEPELARRAVRHIVPAAIAELGMLDNRLDTAISSGDVSGYLRWNYRFHARLYAEAQAPILAGQAQRLWLRFGPSLRVVCGRLGTRNLPDRHRDLLAALRRADGEAAALAMTRDVEEGMSQVLDLLSDDTSPG